MGSELTVPAAPPLVFPESLSNSLCLTQRRSSAVEWNQITEASPRRCEEIKDGETWSFCISVCRRRLQKHATGSFRGQAVGGDGRPAPSSRPQERRQVVA